MGNSKPPTPAPLPPSQPPPRPESAAVLGCDFSSSPSARKAIVLAWGSVVSSSSAAFTPTSPSLPCVRVQRLERATTLAQFTQSLCAVPAWLGGFDLPFGLPRELVQTLGWPVAWEACMAHYCALPRAQVRALFAAFCDARPAGAKFAHRATDKPAGSSPSMKWVNPPVAYMLHAGLPCLQQAQAYFPALQPAPLHTAPPRVALEAYPGLLAREVLGRRSYKSDDRAKHTPERLIARKDLLGALELGQTRLGLRLQLSHAQREALLQDASGDSLDAVLCLLQAAWAQRQHAQGAPLYGLPTDVDPLEGWIVTA